MSGGFISIMQQRIHREANGLTPPSLVYPLLSCSLVELFLLLWTGCQTLSPSAASVRNHSKSYIRQHVGDNGSQLGETGKWAVESAILPV